LCLFSLVKANSEENFRTLVNVAETLEKKDGGDVKQYRDTVNR
jgi:hypothetical protein